MNQGKLELIIGNMFSGKTTELIRRINKLNILKKKYIVINYIDDNRYSHSTGEQEIVCTHNLTRINCIKLKNLMDYNIDNQCDYNIDNQCDYIFIDEAQFFEDLYPFVKLMVDTHHKCVTVAGLSGDINRSEFGHILNLIPIADSVVKLNAFCTICNDGTEAPFTKKINESGIKEIVDIGGADKYISVCRKHYLC